MDSETVISNLNLAPLDALLELLHRSIVMPSWMEDLKSRYLQELLFLRAIFIDPQPQFVDDDRLKEFAKLARKVGRKEFAKLGSKVGCIISAFDLKKMDEEMSYKLVKQLSGPLGTLKFWTYTIQFEMNEPKPSRMYHPRTDQLGFVDHLVENHLEQLLLKRKADLICPLKIYILELQRMLHLISCSPEPRKEKLHIKELIRSITDIAYEVEYIIDSYLVRKISTCCCMSWLRDILSEATYKASLVEVEFGDVKSIVSVILNTEPNKVNIISIVIDTERGINLKEILDDPAIINRFPWSLVFKYKESKKEVFLEIATNFSKSHGYKLWDRRSFMEGEFCEIERFVRRCSVNFLLFQTLIISEDVQDIDAVNDIRKFLPNLKKEALYW